MMFVTLVLVLLLSAAVLAAAVAVWRRPVLGLPVLVAGMAVHNFVIMALVNAGTPDFAVRGIQAWKEGILLVLAVRLGLDIVSAARRDGLAALVASWRRRPLTVRLLDAGVGAFALLLVVYAVLPTSLFPGHDATLTQRLLEFRTLAMIPVLYVFGRRWPPSISVGLRPTLLVVLSAAVVVSVVGLVELWFVPTKTWLDWGVLRLDSWLGYDYHGPAGLPENFFQSTTSGFALRRMVSTYVSPLGVAYTGLLVVPIAFATALASRRHARWAWFAMGLVVVGVALSMTRLALACLVIESVVIALVFWRRAGAMAVLGVILAVGATFLVYPDVGPLVSFDLADVRPPLGAQIIQDVGAIVQPHQTSTTSPSPSPSSSASPSPSPSSSASPSPSPSSSASPSPSAPPSPPPNLSGDIMQRVLSADDGSIQAHVRAIQDGVAFVRNNPFGAGLGSSVVRFGSATVPGESALLAIGGEMGILGLLLFGGLYGALVLVGLREMWQHRRDPCAATLAAIVGVGGFVLTAIVLTSQVWGDLSVTFLFWWAAGSLVAEILRHDPAASPVVG